MNGWAQRIGVVVLVVVSAGSVWWAGRQHEPLLAMRRSYRLNWADPLENAPPLVAFTSVALGGFRGILADLLWLRASRLQQEKKYFELVQLADWITKLEPRFALVWAFHGWNMAYNISVLFDSPVDRWRWVKHGIELMRDQGLYYNPGDAQLHRELGWIFQHKLGNILDQAHPYYKRQWAMEMESLFDGARPDYEFCRTHPDDARVRRMREQYRLEPELMEEIEQRYGPLDWRLPPAHAIYWAYRGSRYARGFDRVQIERMIFQSMQDNFWWGRLVWEKEEDLFVPAPNPEAFEWVNRAYAQAVASHPEEESFRAAHRNFLKDAVLVLALHHHTERAREAFEYLRKNYPEATTARRYETFVREMFRERVREMGQREALAYVEGLLTQAVFWVVAGEEDRWRGALEAARYCWEEYMRTRKDDPKMVERVGLPPLRQMWQQAKERVAQQVQSAPARARLEAAELGGESTPREGTE